MPKPAGRSSDEHGDRRLSTLRNVADLDQQGAVRAARRVLVPVVPDGHFARIGRTAAVVGILVIVIGEGVHIMRQWKPTQILAAVALSFALLAFVAPIPWQAAVIMIAIAILIA
jgi:hypothetical protein